MVATVDLEVTGLLEQQKRMMEVVRGIRGTPMVNAMRDAALYVVADARKMAPVDMGRLAASIIPEVRMIGNEVMGVVGTQVTYAAAVELGSKPHFPPVDAIQAWVRRKKIVGVYSIKTKRRMGNREDTDAQDRAVAFMIARKISIRGTAPRPYLQPAFWKNQQRIVSRINRAVTEIVK